MSFRIEFVTMVTLLHLHMAHFRVFWKWKKPQVPTHPRFTLIAVKSATVQDEGISTDSTNRHNAEGATKTWLVVTSSQVLFLRRIAESSQPSNTIH